MIPVRCRSAGSRRSAFGQFGRYGGDTGGTFKAELEQVSTSAEGQVIGLHHKSAENGRSMSGREYFFDLDNWDEFWA